MQDASLFKIHKVPQLPQYLIDISRKYAPKEQAIYAIITQIKQATSISPKVYADLSPDNVIRLLDSAAKKAAGIEQ